MLLGLGLADVVTAGVVRLVTVGAALWLLVAATVGAVEDVATGAAVALVVAVSEA